MSQISDDLLWIQNRISAAHQTPRMTQVRVQNRLNLHVFN